MRIAYGAAALLALACSCPPRRAEPIDLREAERLLEQGRRSDGLRALIQIHGENNLSTREDVEAREARGRILALLQQHDGASFFAPQPAVLAMIPELRDPTGSDLAASAAGHLAFALATSVEPESHARCAAVLNRLLRLKLASRTLRKTPALRDAYEEKLYERLLLEAAASIDLFALVRLPVPERAAQAERTSASHAELARALSGLAASPTTRPESAAYWSDLAAQAERMAAFTRSHPAEAKLTPSLRSIIESDLEAHLVHASRTHDTAVKRLTGRESLDLVLPAFERSLLHLVLAREFVNVPSARQADVFNTLKADVDVLRRLSQTP